MNQITNGSIFLTTNGKDTQQDLYLRAQARGYSQRIIKYLTPSNTNDLTINQTKLQIAQKIFDGATELGVWDSIQHKVCKHSFQGVHQCEVYKQHAQTKIQQTSSMLNDEKNFKTTRSI